MLVVYEQTKRFNFMENRKRMENGWKTDGNGWKTEGGQKNQKNQKNQKKKEIETQQNNNINTLDEKVH